jgi:hypothetical protein
MHKRVSRMVVLALVFLVVGLTLFLLRDSIAGFAPAARGSWLDGGGAALLVIVLFAAFVCIGVGLLLFLVRPLLFLGPRAPLWLIPLIGVALCLWEDRVCFALYPGELSGPLRADCEFYTVGAGVVLVLFGVVLLVRQFQVFRKRQSHSGSRGQAL